MIAQFLLLIYGICALLLGFSVMKLSAPNQTTMVVFIVSFPVLVLAIFAWLVRNHHGKLYAPGDYRSDDAFLGKPANPSKLGEKLQTEAETEAETETETETEVGGGAGTDDAPVRRQVAPGAVQAPNKPRISGDSLLDRPWSAQRSAFLAETLAFQELQSEFNASIKRNVRMPSVLGGYVVVDGIAETSSGSSIVEVATVKNRNSVGVRVRNVIRNLSSVAVDGDRSIRKLAVFVVEDDALIMSVSRSMLNQDIASLGVEVRIFSLSILLEKYGFSS
ncbi:hypothetical protein ABE444_14110 [Brevundimonas pondensis]|uniref:hypothetical protein n=1 Tax=Brevundimonas pondensis TaxID=2774189 RepID=UPI0032099F7A